MASIAEPPRLFCTRGRAMLHTAETRVNLAAYAAAWNGQPQMVLLQLITLGVGRISSRAVALTFAVWHRSRDVGMHAKCS